MSTFIICEETGQPKPCFVIELPDSLFRDKHMEEINGFCAAEHPSRSLFHTNILMSPEYWKDVPRIKIISKSVLERLKDQLKRESWTWPQTKEVSPYSVETTPKKISIFSYFRMKPEEWANISSGREEYINEEDKISWSFITFCLICFSVITLYELLRDITKKKQRVGV